MRLVRGGTVQFEVNSMLSEDKNIMKGMGQGDPKSSGGFNLAAAPLNHFIAKSPTVDRFSIYGTDIEPVSFADDNLTFLKGDNIDNIIQTLNKIGEYRQVSGMTLNLSKCEILTVNCDEAEVQRLIGATGMRRVTQLKHLGLTINDKGEMQYDTNFAPIQGSMERIAEQYTTSQSSPLGRAIYAKYLLASKYIHRMQNAVLGEHILNELHDTIINMTWTRARPSENTTSHRVHIARSRVAQPPRFGGLSVPDPNIQMKSIRFIWVRKFLSANPETSWHKVLSAWLSKARRPGIIEHLQYGCREWQSTSEALTNISTYWSHVFQSIGEFIRLSHKFHKQWQLIPLIGSEHSPESPLHTGSLRWGNVHAREMVTHGLVCIGQIFETNEYGHIDIQRIKSTTQIQAEFGISVPVMVMNSIKAMISTIKNSYRTQILTTTALPENITTIRSLARKYTSGCSIATELILMAQRETWEWGPYPRSYMTYSREGITSISPDDFSKAFDRVRSRNVTPSVQWTSVQILLRTLWTKVKESNTSRHNITQADTMCSNCGTTPEHTKHLVFECSLATEIWKIVFDSFNNQYPTLFHVREPFPIQISADCVLFHQTPNSLPAKAKNDLNEIMLIIKHVLYRFKFRDNLERYPSVRLGTITSALELEKLLAVRKNRCEWVTGLEAIIKDMKSMVGF